MTKISNKAAVQKKIPISSDTVFGGDNDNDGELVRYDIEALANLIKQLNGNTTSTVKINSYHPSGW